MRASLHATQYMRLGASRGVRLCTGYMLLLFIKLNPAASPQARVDRPSGVWSLCLSLVISRSAAPSFFLFCLKLLRQCVSANPNPVFLLLLLFAAYLSRGPSARILNGWAHGSLTDRVHDGWSPKSVCRRLLPTIWMQRPTGKLGMKQTSFPHPAAILLYLVPSFFVRCVVLLVSGPICW